MNSYSARAVANLAILVTVFLVTVFLVIVSDSQRLSACSICTSMSPTICDEIEAAQVAVFARFESAPKDINPKVVDPEAYKATFRIERILKGEKDLGDERVARVLFFGGDSIKRGDLFLVHGNMFDRDAEAGSVVKWTTPITVDTRGIRYINKMLELPQDGNERLVYAMDYLTDSTEMLRRDAFNELAKAPYATLEKLEERFEPDVLVERIVNKETPSDLRKLYFTLLSICGRPSELPMLEAMIRNYEPKQNPSLAAMIACYLSLRGHEGLPLVEATYLSSEDPSLAVAAAAAVTALRFHGEESDDIDRAQLLPVMRRMLLRPQLAGRVLSDLARWEDWTVIERVAQLFAEADGDSLWIRDPAVRYMLACPLPEAEQQLVRLQEIDSDAVRRAERFMAIENQQNTKSARAQDPPKADVPGDAPNATNGDAEVAPSVPKAKKKLPVQAESPVWLAYLPVAAGLLFVVLLLVGFTRRRGES